MNKIIKIIAVNSLIVHFVFVIGCSVSTANQTPVKSVISLLDGFENISLGMSLGELKIKRNVIRDDKFYFTSDKDLYIETNPQTGMEGINYYFLKDQLVATSFWFVVKKDYADQLQEIVNNITKELGHVNQFSYRTLDGREFLIYPNLIWNTPKAKVKLQFLSLAGLHLRDQQIKNKNQLIELSLITNDEVASEMVLWGIESKATPKEIIEEAESFQKTLEKVGRESEPILKANRLAQQGKWQDAIEAYEVAVKIKHFEGEARLGMARAYEELENYEKAIEHLELGLPLINDWARPKYEKKITELKIKVNQKD